MYTDQSEHAKVKQWASSTHTLGTAISILKGEPMTYNAELQYKCSDTSLVLSRPPPLVENVWWLDMNLLSQRCVQRTYNYYAKYTVIRHVLYLLLNLLRSLTYT